MVESLLSSFSNKKYISLFEGEFRESNISDDNNQLHLIVSCLKEELEKKQLPPGIHNYQKEIVCSAYTIRVVGYLALIRTSIITFFIDDYGVMEESQLPDPDAMKQFILQANDNIELFGQIRISQEYLLSLEVLSRSTDISPVQLPVYDWVSLLERYGLISLLDYWIAEQVARLSVCDSFFGKFHSVSFNISPHSLTHDFVALLGDLNSRYPAFSARSEIEITEFAEIGKQGFEILRQIKAMGFRLSLDDFGAGFSSLKYLKEIGFDYVKLDKMWLAEIRKDHRKIDLVKGLVSFINFIGSKCVLEGVEYKSDEYFVEVLRPDVVQGYFYGKPFRLDPELYKAF